MHGIPIAVKELCITKGINTTGGMTLYADFKEQQLTAKLAELKSMKNDSGFKKEMEFETKLRSLLGE